MSKIGDILAGVALPIATSFLQQEVEEGLESFKAHNDEDTVKNSLKILTGGLAELSKIVKSTKTKIDDKAVDAISTTVNQFIEDNGIVL